MFPDCDAPGESLFMQLRDVLPGLVHHQLPVGCKDFGEAFSLEEKSQELREISFSEELKELRELRS